MGATSIEWTQGPNGETGHTINFWWGCTKVSPGCANCYAEGLDARFHGGEHWGKGALRKPRLEAARKEAFALERRAAKTKEAWEESFDYPDRPPRGPRVFGNSMNDWLDPEVPIEWLAYMLDTIRQTPNLTWMLLTKRPKLWRDRTFEIYNDLEAHGGHHEFADWMLDWLSGVPPHNVWVGTSAEDQPRADERIPNLLKIPARVRFLSCEPLLGPVDLRIGDPYQRTADSYHSQIHWVIVGGESGPNARPMHPDWARSLRDQCQAAGVAFFMKQMGGTKKPFMEIPNDLMIREFPEVDHG